MPSLPTRSSQLIGEVIALGPAPLLKSLGFRRKAHHFFRVAADATCHVSFQSSQWNSPDGSSFTLNLWTYLPALAIASGEVPIVEPAKQRIGHCGTRIGHLLPRQEDYWWKISDPSEVPQIADEVRSAVEKYAIPYLEKAITLQGVSELSGCHPGVRSFPTHSKANALRLLGREQEAIAVEHALDLQKT
ncbi:DUF4304 domain-containing protein [Herbaspirillum sp. VT-16-41]|uniref:DUF4304 domain-containing protein n=1 Tax=Herbaspirillum sp. VT-16-41 TaxID=1953765 RepID=UPI0009811B8C|nr:DUF4304 domain-containing protein [Herbaspirillum sp. VT-16-41]ONN65044.1 hypothetical protein BTM36_17590 [Herbaspirillum sp. VT-16-41]